MDGLSRRVGEGEKRVGEKAPQKNKKKRTTQEEWCNRMYEKV